MNIRKSSLTYGKWRGYILNQYNHCQLFVPKEF
nr:dTDP-4-dehydrorhamnose 3,5-epimerase [Lacticaseibacillus rhamnosus]